MTCDVADEAQAAAMVARAMGEFGRLDMAFNNAGIRFRPATRQTRRPRTSTA